MTLPDDQYYRSLLERYIKGDLGEDEAAALFDFLKTRPDEADRLLNDPALIDHIRRESKGKQPDESASRRMEARLAQSVEHAAEEVRVAARRRMQPLWWAAASVILILAAGAYLWMPEPPGKEAVVEKGPVTSNNDIEPGGNSAVLILADGTEVRLDSAQNGNIAMQGAAKVLKLSNGQLAYSADHNGGSTMVLVNTMRTPRGGQYKLRLPDGTDVWLNSASSITFPTAFTGREREIRITGEAYFEVAPNADMPFIVHKGQTSIRVLGTHFNVEAYDNEDLLKVTLLEGKVMVKGSTPGQALTLAPGQQAKVTEDGHMALARSVEIAEVMAWKNGMFSYKGADIGTIMRQVARWYDVEVIIEEPVHEKFYADVSRNTKISTLLSMLEATKAVSFRIEGKTVRVTAGAR